MRWFALGVWLCGVSVMLGAFGAHSLAERLSARGLELWETSARYLMYGGVGVALCGLAARVGRVPGQFRTAAAALLVGALVFAGTIAALALGAPDWLGAITPLGGALMIGGFALLGFRAWRS